MKQALAEYAGFQPIRTGENLAMYEESLGRNGGLGMGYGNALCENRTRDRNFTMTHQSNGHAKQRSTTLSSNVEEIEITPDSIEASTPASFSEDAIEHLAKILHRKTEHLDPTEDADWAAMSERKKEFFRLCVKAVLREKEAIQQAMRLA